MQVNPFRPLPTVPPRATQTQSNAVPASDSQKLTRGMEGSERAKSIQAIAGDINARTARIQHLNVMAKKMEKEIKRTPQRGSSRIAQLARQLDKDF